MYSYLQIIRLLAAAPAKADSTAAIREDGRISFSFSTWGKRTWRCHEEEVLDWRLTGTVFVFGYYRKNYNQVFFFQLNKGLHWVSNQLQALINLLPDLTTLNYTYRTLLKSTLWALFLFEQHQEQKHLDIFFLMADYMRQVWIQEL